MVAFLTEAGVDGLFALGTTGEGVMLSLDERMRAAAAFREACDGTLIVHCGAQSTADTVALAAHAASIGADGVAVIPPPYYAFGPDAVLAHLAAAAAACEPVPFYPYAFAARSGYRLEPVVVERLRERVSNLAGLKVSEAPFDRVAPYLDLGLPVFVGAEPRAPPDRCPGLLRRSPRSSGPSSMPPTMPGPHGWASSGPRSSGIRSRPRSRPRSAPAAFR
jgi:dihydrodipicolinate synthase/N-acetylneuraminate lyase